MSAINGEQQGSLKRLAGMSERTPDFKSEFIKFQAI